MKRKHEGKIKKTIRAVSLALILSMIIPDTSGVMAASDRQETMAVAHGLESIASTNLPTGDVDTCDYVIHESKEVSAETFRNLTGGKQAKVRNSNLSASGYYYNKLNSTDKLYYAAYLALSKKNVGPVTRLDENNASTYGVQIYTGYTELEDMDVKSVHPALAFDHPEEMESVLYTYNLQPFKADENGRVKYTYYVYFSPKRTYTGAQVAQMERDIKSACDAFYNKLDLSGDDFSKELVIHDALMEEMTYNNKASEPGHVAHTAYGAFVEKKPVCDGYAKAFQMLLDKAGIESHIVAGNNHDWNIVRLGSDYYEVDVTWDDGNFEDTELTNHLKRYSDKYIDIYSHFFFNRTTKEFEYLELGDEIPQIYGTHCHNRGEDLMGYLTAPEARGTKKSFKNVKKVFPVTFDGVKNGAYYYLPQDYTLTYEGKILEMPTKMSLDNYEFDNWYTEATGGTVVTKDTILNKATTVYAHWNTSEVSVRLYNGYDNKYQEIKVRYLGTYGELPVITRPGYIFDGWYTDNSYETEITANTKVTEDYYKSLCAKWSPKEITVKLDNGYNDENQEITVIYNDYYYDNLPKINKDGYVLEGWYTDRDYTNKIESNTRLTNPDDHCLYAKWKRKEVRVGFAHSYQIEDPEKTVDYLEAYGELPVFTRSGYTFGGWYTGTDYKTEVTADTIVTDMYFHWLYAKWIKDTGSSEGQADSTTKQKVTINFHSDFSSIAFQTVKIDLGKTYGDAIDSITQPTSTTHSFKGWFTGYYTDVEISRDTVIESTDELDFYAQWAPEKQDLFLFANGGSFVDGKDVMKLQELYDTELWLSSVESPVREGYVFKGWSEYPDSIRYCRLVNFYREQSLYAVWEKDENNSGDNSNESGNSENSEETTDTPVIDDNNNSDADSDLPVNTDVENTNNSESADNTQENTSPADNNNQQSDLPATNDNQQSNLPATNDNQQNNAPAAEVPQQNTASEEQNNALASVTLPENGIVESDGKEYQLSSSETVAMRASANKNITSVSTGDSVLYGGKDYKVTSIEKNAYKNCKKLKSVSIGSNIEKIGANAFSGCKNLGKITIKAYNLKSIGKGSFKGIKKSAKITIICKDKNTYNKLVKKIKKAGAKKAKFKFKKG